MSLSRHREVIRAGAFGEPLLPDYLTGTERVRYQAAGEARLRGGGDLLALGRAEDTSRHVLAVLQPLEAGEVVRVQWLITGARAPRWVTAPTTEHADIPELWRSGDPMLCATCRVAVSSRLGKRRARSVFGRVWASLRGMNTTRVRMVRRWWIPSVAVVGRLHARVIPRGRWPIVVTSSELAGLLGFAAGAVSLPGVEGDGSRTLPTPPAMPSKGLPIARSNYPGTGNDVTLSEDDSGRGQTESRNAGPAQPGGGEQEAAERGCQLRARGIRGDDGQSEGPSARTCQMRAGPTDTSAVVRSAAAPACR